MTTTNRAIIIGGGIGGLAAAIALKRSGLNALVVERADDLREVGAGLTLFSNAMKALDQLGLGAAIRAVSAPVEYSEIRSWRGDVITAKPFGSAGVGISALAADPKGLGSRSDY
jgi:2-polyprenyl-6-methoxyphenol hydroxylase-like FAD-dependent oxidoreductase